MRPMMAVLRRNSIMAWRESFLGLSAALARDVVERDIGAATQISFVNMVAPVRR
jgi:hypothetical protein